MTVKELKKEAEKLGYVMHKRSVAQRLRPCKCGANRRSYIYSIDTYGIYGPIMKLSCKTCGYVSKPGRTRYEVQKNWNFEMMEYESNKNNK